MANIQELWESKDAEKVKAVKKALGGVRKVFSADYETDADGNETITKTAYEKAKAVFDSVVKASGNSLSAFEMSPEKFDVQTVKFQGMDIDAPQRAIVALLGVRDKKTEDTGYQAVILFAAPEIDTFRQTQPEFVAKLIDKELSLVAFRQVRGLTTVEEMEQGIARMPFDVDGYTSDARAGIDTEAFDKLWPAFRKDLSAKATAVFEAVKNVPKAEIIRGIRSRSYAQQSFSLKTLESNGLLEKIGRALVQIGDTATDAEGKPDPIDTSVISGWLDDRETLQIAATTVDEAKLANFDLSALIAQEPKQDTVASDQTEDEAEQDAIDEAEAEKTE